MKLISSFVLLLITNEVFALNKEWWKHASIYEIYPRSFKDTDGDGIGDIKGVISKLDYLVDLGVDTIYMPPFFPSSMADGGYDITDYKGIDPAYGTMEDFERMLRKMKSRGLHFIMDLVINHSSDEHEWFEKSVERISPYTDYYIWADPKGYDWNAKPIPPNTWFSLFSFLESGSAWAWNEKRKQFYLHNFLAKQPDLNLRNEKVKAEIKDIMKFWLEKGVSGFRVDAPMLFLEDEQLRDNPPPNPNLTVFSIFNGGYERTIHHPDTFKFINELNSFIRQYDKGSGKSTQTPLIGETYGSVEKVMKYYGTKKLPVFDLPFNFLLTKLATYLDARDLRDYLHTWLDAVPKGKPSNWALGNHDKGRAVNHFNADYNSILLSLVAMLPGTATVYFGEELGMGANYLVSMEDTHKRACHRTPMHWDDTKNAGFTSAEESWLPVHPSYWQVNVEAQRSQENSTLNYFKDLISFRKTDAVKYGDLKFHIVSKWVLAFSRTHKRSSYIILMNLGTNTEPIDFHADIKNLTKTLTVVASSPNSGYRKGNQIQIASNYPTSYMLRPHSVLVLNSQN